VTTPIDLISLVVSRYGSGNTGCAVGSDHAAYCWGSIYDQDVGQSIGEGITALAGATSASSVSIDNDALCVTRTDNAARCWGAFYGGTRGTDSVDPGPTGPGFTMTPSGLHPAQAVYGTALGSLFGCAIRTDSLVACWGTRNRGQLAGALSDSVQDCGTTIAWCQPGPATIAGGNKYRAISAFFDHACAVRIGGSVDCWGRKVGTPIPDSDQPCAVASDCPNAPTAVALPASAIRVSVGNDHACALLTTGDVYCWGDNTYGQLGRSGAASLTPVKVSGGFVFVSLSAGTDHTCAIEGGSGAIGCWGRNDHGQLGDGTTTDRSHPVAVVVAQ
jgi:alpha-tubulin suppressor-like RCC1 family protein